MAMPSSALATASTTTSTAEPATSRPEQAERDGGGEQALDDGDAAEGERVAGEQVAAAERGGQQPLERAGRALAQHGHRRQQEHHGEREQREHRPAGAVEGLRAAVEDAAEQAEQQDRDEQQHRDGARVAAELTQDAAGGRQGGAGGHDEAPVARVRKAPSTSEAPVRARGPAGCRRRRSGRRA
jgi:hypothetical protein